MTLADWSGNTRKNAKMTVDFEECIKDSPRFRWDCLHRSVAGAHLIISMIFKSSTENIYAYEEFMSSIVKTIQHALLNVTLRFFIFFGCVTSNILSYSPDISVFTHGYIFKHTSLHDGNFRRNTREKICFYNMCIWLLRVGQFIKEGHSHDAWIHFACFRFFFPFLPVCGFYQAWWHALSK